MVVVDIETTGINPIANSIIEIGAIDFLNPNDFFEGQCKIWEGAEINPFALEVNGFRIEEITDNKLMSNEDLLSEFINWLDGIEDKTIAGHNVDFDIQFLDESAKRCCIDRRFGKRKVDQHSLVFAHILKRGLKPDLKDGISKINGDFIMSYVGIPPEPKPHKALNGAKYETEALSRLIFGEQLFPEFASYDMPEYLLA